MNFLLLDCPLGTLGLLGDNHLRRLILPGQPLPRMAVHTSPLLEETARQLTAYFSGELTAFDLPLAPQGTPFQQEVWQALVEIPYGQVYTYGQLAQGLGRPKAYRAVGQANHHNPIPLVIPCHRVVGAKGLAGYAGGLEAKAWLLSLEGAWPPSSPQFSGKEVIP